MVKVGEDKLGVSQIQTRWDKKYAGTAGSKKKKNQNHSTGIHFFFGHLRYEEAFKYNQALVPVTLIGSSWMLTTLHTRKYNKKMLCYDSYNFGYPVVFNIEGLIVSVFI